MNKKKYELDPKHRFELKWFHEKTIKMLTNVYKNEFDSNIKFIINDYRSGKLMRDFEEFKKSTRLDSSSRTNYLMKRINKNNESIIKLLGIGGYGAVFKISNNNCVKLTLENKKNDYHEYLIPKKLFELDPELQHSIVIPLFLLKNKSFNNIINVICLNALICIIIYNIIKKNNNLINIDLNNLFSTLDIKYEYSFILSKENKSDTAEIYNFIYQNYFNQKFRFNGVFYCLKQMIKLFNKEKGIMGFYMLMPLAEDISTNIYINPKTFELDKLGQKVQFFNKQIGRMIFLQVSIALLKTKKFNYVHNDLKPDNVLVFKKNNPYSLVYNNNNFIFMEKYIFKISDFDFSILPDYVENNKIAGTRLSNFKSWFNDIHYFIHKLFIYFNKDDIELDLPFFKKLHSLFIYPFCQCEFDKMFGKTLIKSGNTIICEEGFYYSNKLPEIKILENFILSDFFLKWRSDKETTESLLSSLKMEKININEYDYNYEEIDIDYI